jgi:hypothetical protein
MAKKYFFLIMTISFMSYAADYFPLAVGNQWKYQINTGEFDPADSSVQMTVTITSDTVIGTDSIYNVVYLFSSMPDLLDSAKGYFLNRGNDVFSFDDLSAISATIKYFEHKPAVGHTWNDGDGNVMTINSIGDVSCPAGHFSSCYMLSSSLDTEIYAPDIGLIKINYDGEIKTLLSCKIVNKTSVLAYRPSCGSAITIERPVDSGKRYSLFDLRGRCVKQDQLITGERIEFYRKMFSSGAYLIVPREGHTRKAGMFLHAN